MAGDGQVVASAYGASVRVSAPAGVLAGLTGLASPYIEVTSAEAPRTAPHVLVRATPPSGDAWRRVVLESEYEPDRVVWVNDARRRLALVNEDDSWAVQQLLRSVRYLLRWQAYERGDLFLHGGLVRAQGTGIAFLGHKRSGKTSSILSALLNGGADFVSNDDLVITDALTGHGSPRTVNVRSSTRPTPTCQPRPQSYRKDPPLPNATQSSLATARHSTLVLTRPWSPAGSPKPRQNGNAPSNATKRQPKKNPAYPLASTRIRSSPLSRSSETSWTPCGTPSRNTSWRSTAASGCT
ncbi:phosphoenolpyruvate carboxykinase (ATP) [Salinispora vitiensis]|uniref:hypothetical protein n=1 Tax=Salinispora vitiensis TaxID=999544 RepID=UPI0003A73442|nr:hypothetical protein [Salinispora vitiensis]